MRRFFTAAVGIMFALVGGVSVVNYAQSADERAAAELETTPIVVAVSEVEAGTAVSAFTASVETRNIPKTAVIDGAVDSLEEIDDLVLAADLVVGEQLVRSRLVSEDEFRARGQSALPDGLRNHHQVTILLSKARALGGDIAPGDSVGVFMSFDVDANQDEQSGGADPEPTEDSAAGDEGGPIATGGGSVSLTDLTLHKVPVVRVEGAFVSTPSGEDEAEGAAADNIFVTLALEPEEAARLVFAAEWGSIYLSREPETAADEDVPSIVLTLPERGQDVLQ